MSQLKKPVIQVALITLTVALCYANTLTQPFHFDDANYISANPAIHNPKIFLNTSLEKGGILYHYIVNRYVGMLTLYMNYKLGATNTTGYHIFNILVHLCNALLVYLLVTLMLRRLDGEDTASGYGPLFAALLFAAHPLQTEAVTYISQRFTSLATMFYLCTLAAYALMRPMRPGRRKTALYIAAIASAILGMKTKEICLTAPLAVAAYEWMFFDDSAKGRMVRLLPLLATMAIIPLTVLYINRPAGELFGDLGELSRVDTPVGRLDYFITQLTVITMYLRLFIFPSGQNLDYDYKLITSVSDAHVLGSFILLAALAGAAGYLYRRAPRYRMVAYGILLFFLALAVESSFIPIRDLVFEHRMYLPMAGLAIALGCAVNNWQGGNATKLAAGALVIALLGGATIARNQVWSTEVSLWEDTAAKSPKKPRALNSLSNALVMAGRQKEGLDVSMRSLVTQESREAVVSIAFSFLSSEKYDEALKYINKAIEADPNYGYSYQVLGQIYLAQGKFQSAKDAFTKSTSLDPYLADSFALLATANGELGRFDEAVDAAQKGVKLDPVNVLALSNLGLAWASLERYDYALPYLKKALGINPKYEAARFNLILAELRLCQLPEAQADLNALGEINQAMADNFKAEFAATAMKCAAKK